MADLRARALGRSRGGLTTKLHAVTDAKGRPVTLHLTAGQAHDGNTGLGLIGTLQAGQTLLADAGYDQNALREKLAACGAIAQIKPLARRNPTPAFDPKAYQRRNHIERFFSKVKQFRAIATRYEKHDDNFLNLIRLASIRILVARL